MSEFSSTDEKIMRATLEILQEEGFSKATTKKIAAKAGVNEVTIFRNFKNKKNLVETTKEHYFKLFLEKFEEIFDFNEDDEIEGYLQSNFMGLLNLSEDDYSIIKIAMEEVREGPERNQLVSRISTTAFDKLDEFFKLQIEKGKIRSVDTRVLAVMCYSMTFQSLVLYRIYEESPNVPRDDYAEKFLDILYNGIKV
ncbi:MAG: TetR/AcrR family transcriptional regulator [Methanobrevibacter sp.]|uniref:TetR/AcrR family transcriptional regulator n=1 Tax=Methanobrevibacter sp. TaxID=66852 RepID=UPI001B67FAAD|nr:TetR/AcrR family transcriptional regulator [Methanobrevibacter sp.]MBP3791757.1 TetR/AcrR family transcriptional regulator [Methanobrevibacter sp.]